MSYSFYTGASGAGKSSELHKKVIEYTSGSLGRYAMYIVPEQYTMQTQKELVLASPNHGHTESSRKSEPTTERRWMM